MTFTAIITAHDQDFIPIWRELHEQDRMPNGIIVLFSGDCRATPTSPTWEVVDWGRRPAVYMVRCEDKNDWGHDKRAEGLALARSDYMGFFNADDTYHPEYIERMMAMAVDHDAGFVYCWWHPMGKCEPKLGSSTSGNFIVRKDVALEAGYTDRHYEADGTFIDRCVAVCDKRGFYIVEVPEILYYHNGRA